MEQAGSLRGILRAGDQVGPIRKATRSVASLAFLPQLPVLYDRHAKRVHDGLELPRSIAGDFDEPDHMADAVGVTWGG